MDVEKLREEWRERLTMSKSASTVENYLRALDKFTSFLDSHSDYSTDPETWDEQALVRFDRFLLEERGLADSTRHMYESALRQFGAYLAVRDEWEENRFQHIELPEIDRDQPDVDPKEEVLEALEYGDVSGVIDKRNRALIWLLYAGALRRAEIQHLKTDQLHLDEDYIRVLGKGKKRRTITLTDDVGQKAVRYLYIYLDARHEFDEGEENPFVFWGRREVRNQPLSSHTIWRVVKKHTGYSPHDLRRARLTHLAESGLPPAYLRDFAGHVSMETTMRYYVAINRENMANAIRRTGSAPVAP